MNSVRDHMPRRASSMFRSNPARRDLGSLQVERPAYLEPLPPRHSLSHCVTVAAQSNQLTASILASVYHCHGAFAVIEFCLLFSQLVFPIVLAVLCVRQETQHINNLCVVMNRDD